MAHIIAMISLMILPLPKFLIDILLSLNLAISVTLLMIMLYVPSIVSLSSFLTLLLFTTLYRLSLNIASTKSILLHAEAGDIIDSFGELVVGGNLVVGIVVFTIITVVQFIVIAKGSERVVEVGARFTLDALPEPFANPGRIVLAHVAGTLAIDIDLQRYPALHILAASTGARRLRPRCFHR